MAKQSVPALLIKNMFWIAMGVILVVGLGLSGYSAMESASRFTSNKQAIDTSASTITGVLNVPDHPNPEFHEGTQGILNNLKRSVREAWQRQYDIQSGLFRWPAAVNAKDRDTLRTYRPIERFVNRDDPGYAQQELNLTRARAEYATFIVNEFPRLAKIIGAKWQVQDASAGGAGPGGIPGYNPGGGGMEGFSGGPNPGRPAEPAPVVRWDSADQQALYARFDYSKLPQSRPGLLQMLYAQEDLWVIESILNVIKATNGDAAADYEAIIKDLHGIHIGRDAGLPRGKVERVQAAPAGGIDGMGMDGYGDSMEGYGESGGGMSMEGSSGSEGMSGMPGMPGASADPAQGRYVTNEYQPLSGDELRSSFTTQDPSRAYLAVAKRMPVRLQVTMDQRYLSKLLAECANSPLTIEIRQVRLVEKSKLSPRAAGSGGMGGFSGGLGMEGFSGGGDGMPGGMEGFSGGMEGYGGGGMNPAAAKAGFDKTVELYGVIYIYNPPDESILDVVAATDDGASDTPTAPTTPTVPTTPAAPPATPSPTPASPEPTDPVEEGAAPPTDAAPATPAPAGEASTAPATSDATS